MGETYDQVKKEIERVPYKVVRSANGMPRIDIDGREYTPQEISAMILQKMKKTAEDYLGTTIDEAVITGPSISRTSSGKSKLSKAATISTEINLLGKTVDEAVAELDKYLDDAYLSHLPSVRVVHGKGTGALRKGIHNYLRRQKHVADFHLAEFGEGDAGVTIVTFKK